MPGIYAPFLETIEPQALITTYPTTMTRSQALAAARSAPSNDEVLAACKDAYRQHVTAVDTTTLGSIATASDPDRAGEVAAARAYDWGSRIAAPGLTRPLLQSQGMAQARSSVEQDGDFATFALGIEANLDLFVGGFGGVGVGFGFPSGSVMWMAWGGIRISMNIDIAINLTAAIFTEPPEEVAGDFLGIEVTCEPVAEGPSIGFGIHLSPDLSALRGFTVAVGAELGLLPVNAAIERGHIVTS